MIALGVGKMNLLTVRITEMSAVRGPKLTAVQQRRRFVSMEGDSTVFGPEVTSKRSARIDGSRIEACERAGALQIAGNNVLYYPLSLTRPAQCAKWPMWVSSKARTRSFAAICTALYGDTNAAMVRACNLGMTKTYSHVRMKVMP
jgi:hypothetical protein